MAVRRMFLLGVRQVLDLQQNTLLVQLESAVTDNTKLLPAFTLCCLPVGQFTATHKQVKSLHR